MTNRMNDPRPPRWARRNVPYRPERETTSRGSGGGRLIWRFFVRYMWPHRRPLFVYILFTTLTACSTYLISYYGRIVVDDILCVNVPAVVESFRARLTEPSRTVDHVAEARATVSRSAPAEAESEARAGEGRQSETFRAATASRRPPDAGRRLFILFLIYAGTVVGLNIASRLATYSRSEAARRIDIDLRTAAHRKILGLSTGYLQTTTPGRLMARILSDNDVIQGQLLTLCAQGVSQVAMLVLGFVILIAASPVCAAVVLFGCLPYGPIVSRLRSRIREFNREARHSNACLWGLVSQKLDAIKAVFAYGRERGEARDFFRLSAVMQRDNIQSQKTNATVTRFAQLLTVLVGQIVFLYCTVHVLSGTMSLGSMMFIYGAATTLFSPIIVLTQMMGAVEVLLVAMHRVAAVLENPNEIVESPDARPFPVPIQTGITVENLSFRYSDSAPLVLSNVNLSVPRGSWLCITGPSGAGKTTLLNLVARLYDPTTGRVAVDGVDLRDVRQRELHTRVSMVPQEAQILSGTVRSNLIYGVPGGAEPSRIMEVAKAADCHDFIMKLPVKYETVVGEKGMTLSGGQRQRLSIARALMTNPDVILLDDCTSALDASTERKIQETLEKVMAGKTAIIVSQRVSMALRCDQIVVLEDGHVTERGTHAQLVQRGGFYAKLVETQSGRQHEEAGA